LGAPWPVSLVCAGKRDLLGGHRSFHRLDLRFPDYQGRNTPISSSARVWPREIIEDTMTRQLTKRDVLRGTGALSLSAFAVRVAAAPAAEVVTPALIEATKKEGKVSFYTAMDLQFAERLGKAFEAKYLGIAVRVERSGAERVFTRIGKALSLRVPPSLLAHADEAIE